MFTSVYMFYLSVISSRKPSRAPTPQSTSLLWPSLRHHLAEGPISRVYVFMLFLFSWTM